MSTEVRLVNRTMPRAAKTPAQAGPTRLVDLVMAAHVSAECNKAETEFPNAAACTVCVWRLMLSCGERRDYARTIPAEPRANRCALEDAIKSVGGLVEIAPDGAGRC